VHYYPILDEIGDIPISVQTKLLRAIQEQEIKPLGTARTRKIDVRVIASTNQNLEEKIRQRTFREDLYYRLNVVTLTTPSLAEIHSDIPLLVNHFSRLASLELGIAPRRFTSGALALLKQRSWPGNVRELQNFVPRVVTFSADSVIRARELQALEDSRYTANMFHKTAQATPQAIEPYKQAKDRVVKQFTFDYVSSLLQQTGGNVTKAADLSGLGRASLQKIMRRLGIRSESYKQQGSCTPQRFC